MINLMSAMTSAFTILFLFWTITAFAKRILGKIESQGQVYSIMGAGLVGSLAYTFSAKIPFKMFNGFLGRINSALCSLTTS